MNQPLTVTVITTGGTIDKAYFDALSTYQVGEPAVRGILGVARVGEQVKVVELFRKDSLELTDADRAQLRERVAAEDAQHIVITHGTDTMVQSAAVLQDIAGKTIVFTGALAPARFAESDASFNLGMAFAAAQTLPPGVYVAMSGQVFPADAVRKDRSAGRFVACAPGNLPV